MAITTVAEMAEAMPDASQLLSDEPEMESSSHYTQLALLVSGLEWRWRERDDFFIGANLTIYFSRQQFKSRDFRGPDFFLVLGTERKPRPSWVVWEEGGKYPDLIIELLSTSTAEIDRDVKREIYQERFRTPEYFWFSPDTLEFMGWRLVEAEYQEVPPDERGWRWSKVLGLYLGILEGRLRYFTPEGTLVPTLEEAAEQAIKRAEQETKRAEQAAQRAELQTQRAEQETQRADRQTQRAEQEAERAARLETRLRELGVDPTEL